MDDPELVAEPGVLVDSVDRSDVTRISIPRPAPVRSKKNAAIGAAAMLVLALVSGGASFHQCRAAMPACFGMIGGFALFGAAAGYFDLPNRVSAGDSIIYRAR